MVEQMVVPTTRVAAPSDDPALLERQTQPLYSAAVLNLATAFPPVLNFFNYAQGANISGAGIAVVEATRYHTNLNIPNQLGRPKIFVYRGARVWVPPIVPEVTTPTAAVMTDPTVGTAGVNNDFLDVLKLLMYTGLFFFELSGLKRYLEVPLTRVPGNTGIRGEVSMSGTQTADDSLRSETFHTGGRPLRIYDEVLISSQQTFSVQIRFHSPTNASTVDHLIVFVALMGELGREIL